MRKTILLLLIGLGLAAFAQAQPPANLPQLLAGKRIALDPGHGGHDSDDRQIILGNGFTYWESDCNWEVSHLLKDLLEATGASVKLTRSTNDPAAPDRDPFLSERVAVANAFGADYMHSIHTNAANGSANYTLLLYRGINETAEWPEAKRMGDIMSPALREYVYTTAGYNRADRDFLPYYLGVLAGTNMPATLSEAAFHDHLPEGKRLMSPMYRKAMAWSMAKSFFEFYGVGGLPYGEVGGLVRDQGLLPQNGAVCTLKGEGLERTVTVDNADGGYYLFDWVPAGSYTLSVSKEGCAPAYTNISVQAGKYARTDIPMTNLASPPSRPLLRMVGVGAGATSLAARWDKVEGADGYRLYYATDDGLQTWKLAADEQTLKGDATSLALESEAAFKQVPTAPANHFRLTAVRLVGGNVLEGDASDVYSRSSGGTGDRVLIVDGFDRRGGQTSYTQSTHAFATYYGTAIRKGKNAHFSTADHQLLLDGTLKLKDYQAVVWFLSDESTADETFSLQEQALLKEYMQAGGKLLASGPEIGWDLSAKGTADDKAFYADYLKSVFQDDGAADFLPASGATGTPFEGLKMDVGARYTEDFPDAMTPVTGALRILDYAKAGYGAGVAYWGAFGSGTVPGGVIHVGFGLENLPQGQLDAFMAAALNYLKVNYVAPPKPAPPCFSSRPDASATWIDRLKVGAYDKQSGNNEGYADYSKEAPIAQLSAGKSYPAALYAQFAAQAAKGRWKIWVDLNGDGDYTDAGELLLDGYTTGAAPLLSDLNIPSTAQPGVRGMRVAMTAVGPDFVLEPCTAFAQGEVEDYRVEIVPAVVSGLEEDAKAQGFALSPNPATDQAWLQLPAELSGRSLEARLFTVAGAHVATWVLLPDAGQTRMPLPVARLSAGLYLLQLPGQDGRPVVLRLLKR